ncbi:hypothetical protein J3459_013651 [Metarhizium acridum]|nr:hypothetical protein J3459_013651 [Metarhizium acridum]
MHRIWRRLERQLGRIMYNMNQWHSLLPRQKNVGGSGKEVIWPPTSMDAQPPGCLLNPSPGFEEHEGLHRITMTLVFFSLLDSLFRFPDTPDRAAKTCTRGILAACQLRKLDRRDGD